LPCVTYYVTSPFSKAHGKILYRVKMSRAPFAVRLGKMRTAKAVPCVERDSGSDRSVRTHVQRNKQQIGREVS
jgi:hypothetical protein